MSLDAVTAALRTRSPALLREELGHAVGTYDGHDDRDLMLALAPMHDCARRLGVDPVALFDEVAAEAPAELAVLLAHFGRRTDITAQAFGFEVVRRADGPAYAWT